MYMHIMYHACNYSYIYALTLRIQNIIHVSNSNNTKQGHNITPLYSYSYLLLHEWSFGRHTELYVCIAISELKELRKSDI